MFINPKRAVDEGWITGIVNPAKQLQPNAIDFSLDILKLVDWSDTAKISETNKVMRTLIDAETDADGNWLLEGGRVYDGTSNIFVKVPKGVAATLFTRSTFARNGIFVVSGLYDSGYEGHIGFTIYTIGGPAVITPGTRIGQIGFLSADASSVYAGGYNHQQGTHYAESDSNQVDPPVAGGAPKLTQGAMPGHRQIPSDPRRTETGMGPLLGNDSPYI